MLAPMPGPKVSVVVPVQRGAEALSTSLRSVLNQGFGDFEVLVAGDGADAEVERVASSTGVDRLFVASGLLKIVCYDGREGSPTFGRINEFSVSDRNPGLLRIPPNIYHGWKNIGVTEAIVINLPTTLYDYESPDSFDFPWDGAAAGDLIPYCW